MFSTELSSGEYSLFRQGCLLYELIPTMPDHRLVPLLQEFAKAVSRARVFPNRY